MKSGVAFSLTGMGLVRVSGEDAVSFIQGQFTNDIANLGANSCLAGYCSPEGRLLAVMLVWKMGGDVWLLLPRDILPALLKRLQMYVLRAKVLLHDMSDSFFVTGFAGKNVDAGLAGFFDVMPSAVFGRSDSSAGTLISFPDAFGAPRYLLVSPVSQRQHVSALFAMFAAGNEALWALGDIEASVPWIVTETQNRFVPQMVNLELVGGMSFTKGCYPGQEVIARLQYRGTMKRRMFPAHVVDADDAALETVIMPGMDVFSREFPDEPCGTLLACARRDADRIDCLVVLQRDVFGSKTLCLGSAKGPALVVDPLPYSLLEQQVK